MSQIKAPNYALRYQRERRNWTQEQAAEALLKLCGSKRRGEVNARMISKWERGVQIPNFEYREKLCELYGIPSPEELGFLQREHIFNVVDSTSQESFPSNILLASFHPFFKQQEHVWLTLGANSLGQLLNDGWSSDEIFASLRIVLEGVQAMPVNMQRQALQSVATSMIANLPPTTEENISEEEKAILCERLGRSIGDAWKLFHSSNATQLLVIGQSLLSLIQYNHSHLYPEVQPLFYSTVYMLIGATQYILGRYKEAQKTLDTAYITSLESADAWIVAQVLSWQAYVYDALGQHTDAIYIVDRALGVLSHHEDGEYLRLRLRLLAFSAEMSASLGNRAEVQRRLDDAEKYVDSFSVPHEEFDSLSWLQHTGTCALNLGHYPVAVQHLQQSLNKLPSQWKLRYISTAISLIKALIHTHDLDGVVEVSQKTIPMIQSVQATVFAQKLVAYLQEDLLDAFPQEESCRTFVAEVRQQLTQLG